MMQYGGTRNTAISEQQGESIHNLQLIAIITIVPFGIMAVIVFLYCACPSLMVKVETWLILFRRNYTSRGDDDVRAVVRGQVEHSLRRQTTTSMLNTSLDANEEEIVACKRKRLMQSFEENGVILVISDSMLQVDTKSDMTRRYENERYEDGVGKEISRQQETKEKCILHGQELQPSITESTVSIPPSILDEKGMDRHLTNANKNVYNICAICLSEYQVGEKLVWSNNQSCRHAFHAGCILDFLQNQRGTPCPCCRVEFVDQWLQ